MWYSGITDYIPAEISSVSSTLADKLNNCRFCSNCPRERGAEKAIVFHIIHIFIALTALALYFDKSFAASRDAFTLGTLHRAWRAPVWTQLFIMSEHVQGPVLAQVCTQFVWVPGILPMILCSVNMAEGLRWLKLNDPSHVTLSFRFWPTYMSPCE